MKHANSISNYYPYQSVCEANEVKHLGQIGLVGLA